MTANPDSALRQALVAAEKAIRPFAALITAIGDGVFLDSDPIDARHFGPPYNDFPPLLIGDAREAAPS